MNKVLQVGLAVLAVNGLATPSNAASYLVGISPNHGVSNKVVILKETLRFVLDTVEPGDEVKVFDALHQQPITTFNVPV